jgi:hypothetical protein
VKIFKFAVCLFLALTLQAAEAEKRGLGMIRSGPAVPHIAVGADTWSTDFDIVCLSNTAQAFTLSFYDSQGDAMSLDLYDENGQFIGTKVSHTGVVPQQGVIFLRTRNTGAVLKQGYAVLENTDPRDVGVTAIITNSFAGQANFRASVPALSTFNHRLRLPFTNTNGFNTCIAFRSDAPAATQSIQVTAMDASGGQLGTPHHMTLQAGWHTAFCLWEILPLTVGKVGVVDVTTNTGITGIAFTFDPNGRFWTQIPYDVDFVPN